MTNIHKITKVHLEIVVFIIITSIYTSSLPPSSKGESYEEHGKSKRFSFFTEVKDKELSKIWRSV